VHTDPDTHIHALGPTVQSERPLGLEDCARGPPRVVEDDEELVAAVVDHVAAEVFDRLAQKAPVIGEDQRVAVAKLAHELRRALDVGEDQGDRAIGKIGCQRLLQGDLGPNTGSRAGRAVHGQLAS
jgi:hypothetical protein